MEQKETDDRLHAVSIRALPVFLPQIDDFFHT